MHDICINGNLPFDRKLVSKKGFECESMIRADTVTNAAIVAGVMERDRASHAAEDALPGSLH